MKSIGIIIWKSTAFFLLWSILYFPFVVWLAPNLESAPLNLRLYFDATGALTILIAAWVLVSFVDRRSFSSLGFAPTHFFRDSVLGILIGIAWLTLALTIMWLFGWLALQTTGQLDLSTLATAAIAMMLNTVIQELLARGYIFQTIQSQSNASWTVIVTSIIFVLYHAAGLQGSWLAALNIFCAGALFGIVYSVTGNLWLPIAIHFAWNFLLGPVLGLSVSGQDLANSWHVFTLNGPTLFTGGNFGVEGSLIVTLVTLLGIFVLLRWYPRQSTAIQG
jgi:membrane protease YdiL (CAAX protease family)